MKTRPLLKKCVPIKINFIKSHDGARLHLDLGIEDLLNDALRRFKDEVSTSILIKVTYIKIESRYFQQFLGEFINDFDFVSETICVRLYRKAIFVLIVMSRPETVLISIANPDPGTPVSGTVNYKFRIRILTMVYFKDLKKFKGTQA
jgi:hypothetical protein